MSFSSTEIESVLAIDVGTVHTRAYLFEITDDKFHFIAQGITRTTAEAATRDIGEGILLAIKNLEIDYRKSDHRTGRTICDPIAYQQAPEWMA